MITTNDIFDSKCYSDTCVYWKHTLARLKILEGRLRASLSLCCSKKNFSLQKFLNALSKFNLSRGFPLCVSDRCFIVSILENGFAVCLFPEVFFYYWEHFH